MIKYDKIIKALEQKQNRSPKEESGLMELKRLEGIIKEISEKWSLYQQNQLIK